MKPLIAGNWKMNGTIDEAMALVDGIAGGIEEVTRGTEILVIPPFTALADVFRRIRSGHLPMWLGAQDLYWEQRGAFTGEISGRMLRDVGCSHVLIGHSERRTLFGESDDVVLRKLRTATQAGLIPLLCIGERLEERENGRTTEVIDGQLVATLFRIENIGPVVLAYEPVWAIGTGRNASPEQVVEVHRHIRARLEASLGEPASEIRILYGGSVSGKNAREILACPEVDGVLVGGSSLNADEFLAIAHAAMDPEPCPPPLP